MFSLERQSKWNFITAGNAGLNIDVFAMTGGQLVLADPHKRSVRFNYGGAGAGLGFGIKLPKIGKLEFKPLGKSITGTAGPESFPNNGAIYMTEFFRKEELGEKDFEGACLIVDGGGGMLGGYSVTTMLLGINPAKLALAVTSPILSLIVGQAEPNAIIFVRGPNIGLQFGGGVAGYVGYVV